MTDILDHIEQGLKEFRPRTGREYVALQIATRFNDVHRLARYLVVAKSHSKREMLKAARDAMLQRNLNRASTGDLFFELIGELDEKGVQE